MILRPVSPQSACGPPSSNWPVGFTKISKSSSANCSGSDGRITCSISAGRSVAVDADARAVLRRDEHGVEPHRHAVLVLDRHLRLAVGAEEVDDALLAHLGEPLGQRCASQIGIGMSVVGLVARVAEHHALVAGADLVVGVAGAGPLLERLVDTHRDVGRLLVDRDDHAAGLAVDAERGVGVADLADRVAGEAREVDVRLGADLAGDDAQTGRDQRLARDAAVRVLGQDRVEDAVADLVRHLVGVALGDRLRRERVLAQRSSPPCSDRRSRFSCPDARRIVRTDAPVDDRDERRDAVDEPARRARPSSAAAAPRRRRRRRARRRGWCRPRSRRRRRSTSLATIRSTRLAGAAWRRRWRRRSLGLGREADQHLVRRACARRGRRGCRAVGSSTISGTPSLLLGLLGRSAPWAGSRRRRRPSRSTSLRSARGDAPPPRISAAVSTRTTSAMPGGDRPVDGRDERDVRAPAPRPPSAIA